mmetsp:Transcript_22299/g.69841  ORF Transcript_22299/g.69841 Transcript_22299/m.69841 type:complete len:401 (+) Transcript_22299:272-1474(+)
MKARRVALLASEKGLSSTPTSRWSARSRRALTSPAADQRKMRSRGKSVWAMTRSPLRSGRCMSRMRRSNLCELRRSMAARPEAASVMSAKPSLRSCRVAMTRLSLMSSTMRRMGSASSCPPPPPPRGEPRRRSSRGRVGMQILRSGASGTEEREPPSCRQSAAQVARRSSTCSAGGPSKARFVAWFLRSETLRHRREARRVESSRGPTTRRRRSSAWSQVRRRGVSAARELETRRMTATRTVRTWNALARATASRSGPTTSRGWLLETRRPRVRRTMSRMRSRRFAGSSASGGNSPTLICASRMLSLMATVSSARLVLQTAHMSSSSPSASRGSRSSRAPARALSGVLVSCETRTRSSVACLCSAVMSMCRPAMTRGWPSTSQSWPSPRQNTIVFSRSVS